MFTDDSLILFRPTCPKMIVYIKSCTFDTI